MEAKRRGNNPFSANMYSLAYIFRFVYSRIIQDNKCYTAYVKDIFSKKLKINSGLIFFSVICQKYWLCPLIKLKQLNG